MNFRSGVSRLRPIFGFFIASAAGHAADPLDQWIGTWIRSQGVGGVLIKVEVQNPPMMRISMCKPDGACGMNAVTFQYDRRTTTVPPDMEVRLRRIDRDIVEEHDWAKGTSELKETDLWMVAKD